MPKIKRLSATKGKPKQRSRKIIFRPNNPQTFGTIEAALEAYPQTKKSDWLTADSKIEYERFNFLLEALANGQISKMEFHPPFTLVPSMKLPRNAIRREIEPQRAVTYKADFSYYWRGILIVEDVKASYSNTEKNREKKMAGKPIMKDGVRDKHKMLIYQMTAIHESDFHFRIVTDAKSPIDCP